MSAHKPLEGVKVVELASFVAAPTAGRMMAEMGADVIRVESTAGDPWRFYGANCGLPITDEENPLSEPPRRSAWREASVRAGTRRRPAPP